MAIKFLDETYQGDGEKSAIQIADRVDEETVFSALVKRGDFPDYQTALITLVAEKIAGLGIHDGEHVLYPTAALLARNGNSPESRVLTDIYALLQRETRDAAQMALALKLGDQATLCAGGFDRRGFRRMGEGFETYTREMASFGYKTAHGLSRRVAGTPESHIAESMIPPLLQHFEDVVSILRSFMDHPPPLPSGLLA